MTLDERARDYRWQRTDSAHARAQRRLRRQPCALAYRYAAFSAAWLGISDLVYVHLPMHGDERLIYLVFKGILFIGVSSLLIFWLQRRAITRFLESSAIVDRLTRSYAQLFSGLPTPCLVVQPDTGEIEEVNDAAVAIYGWSMEEFRGKPLADLVADALPARPPQGRGRRDAAIGAFARHLARDGRLIDVQVFSTELALAERTLRIVICLDVTAQLRTHELLRLQATVDPLTGLPNRALIHERLTQAIREAADTGLRLALLLIDLDNFKLINDTRGHAFGDLYLREVATRLGAFADGTTTVARLGGDEFLVLIADLDSPAAPLAIAGAVRKAIARPSVVDGLNVVGTCSIGIAVYPDHGDDPAALLSAADAAMYGAKRAGRDGISVFEDSLRQETARYASLVQHLRRALANGELRLRYQPQFAIAGGGIIGIEALSAWTTPEGAEISASEFIPAAERSGLILDLGRWAFREAMTQLVQWRRSGLYLGPLAVNVSPAQLRGSGFPEFVLDTIHGLGVDPDAVELEITETVALQLDAKIRSRLHELDNMGVSIVIDDFGRGYSSLSHFKQLPVHKVKIDASFVRNVQQSRDNQAIVRSMLLMTQALGLTTVAEGVESEPEAEWLRHHGCDAIQGYLYSRPVSASALGALLEKTRASLAPAAGEN